MVRVYYITKIKNGVPDMLPKPLTTHQTSSWTGATPYTTVNCDRVHIGHALLCAYPTFRSINVLLHQKEANE